MDLPDGKVVDAFAGFPGGGKRIVQDGTKVGTTTWVFEGRAKCRPERHKGWVILHRDVAPAIREVGRESGFEEVERVWMAYHPDRPMGDSAMTGREIGPCLSRDEVVAHIEKAQSPTSWL